MSDALGEVEMSWIVAPVQMLDAIGLRIAIIDSCPALSDAKTVIEGLSLGSPVDGAVAA